MDFNRLYEYRFRMVNQASKDAVWKEISEFVCQLMGNPAKVLDPAAGSCEFIRNVPGNAERWAVDMYAPPPAGIQDITFIQEDIFSVRLPENYFDGVFISNFLEHLDDFLAVGKLLDTVYSATRPGGRIAILGPNFKFCMKNYYDVADHKMILTHISVEELLYACGYSIERSIPRFLPFSFRSRLPASALLTRIYLKIPLAWNLLGAQYLVIAKK